MAWVVGKVSEIMDLQIFFWRSDSGVFLRWFAREVVNQESSTECPC